MKKDILLIFFLTMVFIHTSLFCQEDFYTKEIYVVGQDIFEFEIDTFSIDYSLTNYSSSGLKLSLDKVVSTIMSKVENKVPSDKVLQKDTDAALCNLTSTKILFSNLTRKEYRSIIKELDNYIFKNSLDISEIKLNRNTLLEQYNESLKRCANDAKKKGGIIAKSSNLELGRISRVVHQTPDYISNVNNNRSYYNLRKNDKGNPIVFLKNRIKVSYEIGNDLPKYKKYNIPRTLSVDGQSSYKLKIGNCTLAMKPNFYSYDQDTRQQEEADFLQSLYQSGVLVNDVKTEDNITYFLKVYSDLILNNLVKNIGTNVRVKIVDEKLLSEEKSQEIKQILYEQASLDTKKNAKQIADCFNIEIGNVFDTYDVGNKNIDILELSTKDQSNNRTYETSLKRLLSKYQDHQKKLKVSYYIK